MKMHDCPFCRVLNTEKHRVIKDGKLTFTLLSNPRLLPGHTLVIPKRHITEPWKLTKPEILEIFTEINELSIKMLASGLGEGVDVRQNFRPFVKQDHIKVDHLHFHVLPRKFEDELYQKSMRFEKEVFKELSQDEEDKIKKLIS